MTLTNHRVLSVASVLFILIVIEGIMGSQVREITDALAKMHAGQLRSAWVGELEQTWVYLVHRSFSWAILGCGIWFLRSSRAALGRLGWLEKSIFALIFGQMLLGVVLSQIGIVAAAQILHIGLSSLRPAAFWLLGSTRTTATVCVVSDRMSETTDNPPSKPSTLNDLMVLTKFRLSALVIVTTFVGFWLGSRNGINVKLLIHTIIGSTLAAFGAGVFNQLMEIDPDSKMTRTAERPLPSGRISPSAAFGIGCAPQRARPHPSLPHG